LNGTHDITFGTNVFAADGKAQLWAGGCKSANSTYTTEWKHHKQEIVHPSFPANASSYVQFHDRRQAFNQINKFRQGQMKAFCEVVKTIKANSKLKQEEKVKKFKTEYNKLMVKAVRQKAIEIRTGCVHHEPFEIAAQTVPCPLHMDTNEFMRVLEHIVYRSAALTIAHWDCEERPIHFWKLCGKSSEKVANVKACPAGCPLVKVLELLTVAKLGKVAEYFHRKYSPPGSQLPAEEFVDVDEDSDVEEDAELVDDEHDISEGVADSNGEKNGRIRLIGESVKKLSPIMADLVHCLKPTAVQGGKRAWPDETEETGIEFRQRLVCHCYVHLLRCHSALLSSWTINPAILR
jgi:uncharacterized protein (DUF952 family)